MGFQPQSKRDSNESNKTSNTLAKAIVYCISLIPTKGVPFEKSHKANTSTPFKVDLQIKLA